MKQNYGWIFLLAALWLQCKTETKTVQATGDKEEKRIKTKTETILHAMQDRGYVSAVDLKALSITDTTTLYYLDGVRDSVYCTDAKGVNDRIFYSVIGVPDTFGICSYMVLVTVDRQLQKIVDDRFMYAGCNVDLSTSDYTVSSHELVSPYKVDVFAENYVRPEKPTKETDHDGFNLVRTDTTHYTISSEGKISLSGFIPKRY
jgi:hypothetical protein